MSREDVILGVIVLVVTVIIAVAILPKPSIAKGINDKFSIRDRDGNISIYSSSYDVNKTVGEVRKIKKPYDQKSDAGKYILLYDKHVVVVQPSEERGSIVEVMGHSSARRRHRGMVTRYWGGTFRNGSIGNPPVRGGGFGFGK